MRILVTTALLMTALLSVPPASADLTDGETRQYVGPSNGADPCSLVDAGEFVSGGACFEGAPGGQRVSIRVDDETGEQAYTFYRVFSAEGTLLSSGAFCGATTSPTLHPDAARISVSVYVGVFVAACPGTLATGMTGAITVTPVEA